MSFGSKKEKVDKTLETEQTNIAREQYDDYLRRFKPVETEVLDDIQDDASRERLIAEAGAGAERGFDTVARSSAVQQSRTGFNTTTEDAKRVGTRRLGLGRALANVNAQNQTRVGLHDRLLAVTGKAVGTGRGIAQSGTQGLSAAAQLENANNARVRQNNAADDSETASAIGTVASIAAMAFSSREYKDEIYPALPEDLLALVNRILPVTFTYKPEFGISERMIGAIAEDVPAEFANHDRKALNIYNLVGSLVGAVQALTQRVKELEST